jgi:hypothetical protein
MDDQEETTLFEEHPRLNGVMEPSEIFFAKIGKDADFLSVTTWSAVVLAVGGCAMAVHAAMLLCP